MIHDGDDVRLMGSFFTDHPQPSRLIYIKPPHKTPDQLYKVALVNFLFRTVSFFLFLKLPAGYCRKTKYYEKDVVPRFYMRQNILIPTAYRGAGKRKECHGRKFSQHHH